MADFFVRSTDGSDADNGTTWALAKATIAGVAAVMAAGDRGFISKSHAESTAGGTLTITFPGTATAPNQVLCVDDTGDPVNPTMLATSGSVTTTLTGNMSVIGFVYIYGLIFSAGTGSGTSNLSFANTTVSSSVILESCRLRLGGTGASSRLNTGNASASPLAPMVELRNTSMRFGVAGQGIQTKGRFAWRNTDGALSGIESGGTLPTSLFLSASVGHLSRTLIEGVDLSALGSGKSLVNVGTAQAGDIVFRNCKLDSAVAITTGTHQAQGSLHVLLDNCDGADTNYRMHHEDYTGSVKNETTIVRTGGATDGTTPISWKIVTSANAGVVFPLVTPEIVVWNSVTGSAITITAEIVNDGVTLKDDEAWIDIDYLGVSSFPWSKGLSDRKADLLATAANQTSSSVTWTTTGLSSPIKQSLAVTVTPVKAGFIHARINVAKTSQTLYVCPKLTVT